MSTMNISLPASFKAFIEERVESGGYSTSSEYLRDLIRQDHEREHMRQLIKVGLEAPRRPVDAKFWASKSRRLARRK